ncbi:MAG TPA: ThiF family adenylyltransferase [Gemmataceae bacterium]|nr:ThiF family adenylyltransferase [Gemmataceae bacterium]
MATRTVTIIGNGGGANLTRNLARCNIKRLNLVDFDHVEAVNVCRQEHAADQVGWPKVEALARELRRINSGLQVRRFTRNFCEFSDREIDQHFGETDLFVFAVDNLAANARGNEVALRLGKPAIWSGLYAGGRAGEVVWWKRDLPCFRCLCGKRYALRDRGADVGQLAESADIFAIQYLDSVAGMIALGLLTADADNAYGRLIERLGDRNFLQLKISSERAWQDRDVIREQLQIPANNPGYLAWCTAARRDPAGGQPPRVDCQTFRGGQRSMEVLIGLVLLGIAAWGAARVAVIAIKASRTRPLPSMVRPAPPRPDPVQVERVANAQARAFQLALLQLAQTPDFRRTASAVAGAKAVPVAFRRRQFARFRLALVAHSRRCRMAGTDPEVLRQSLRELVTGLGVAKFEADYILQAATVPPAIPPRPAAPAERIAALRQDHDDPIVAIRQGVGEDTDLREQLLEAEDQRYREALLGVVGTGSEEAMRDA